MTTSTSTAPRPSTFAEQAPLTAASKWETIGPVWASTFPVVNIAALTDVFEADGQTHASTDCPVARYEADVDGAIFHRTPVARHTGWICSYCIDVDVIPAGRVASTISMDAPTFAAGSGAASTPADRPAAAEADVATLADQLGRKFEAGDMTPALTAFATEWAKSYDGDFAFMVDMAKAARRGRLSAGMAKGVLNCWNADRRRKATTSPTTPATAPAAAKATTTRPDVPAGRYAYTADDGKVAFVKVDRPEKGRWAGYTFASYLAGGGEAGSLVDAGRINHRNGALDTVLAKIADLGLAESRALFGQTAKACARCGRGLTDQGNPYFAAGLGPECGGKA